MCRVSLCCGAVGCGIWRNYRLLGIESNRPIPVVYVEIDIGLYSVCTIAIGEACGSAMVRGVVVDTAMWSGEKEKQFAASVAIQSNHPWTEKWRGYRVVVWQLG